MRRTQLYPEQLLNYLKKNLKKGYTRESLKWALVGQGHSRREIDRAFDKLNQELAKQAPILKTKPVIKYERIEPKIIPPVPEKKSILKRLFS